MGDICSHSYIFLQHMPSSETRGVVNLVGDYVGDATVRGKLHLRLASTSKDLLGLDPTQVRKEKKAKIRKIRKCKLP
jgi:hypothetical protein